MGTTTAAVWNHLALTWDGTIWRAYLNGIAGATATTTNYWNASQALIVQNNASATTWQMADVAVWSIALAPAQIVDLANGRRADHVVPGNMLIYWPILGQSPEPDKSGNTNNGTVAGTTVVADPAQLEAWSPQYVSLGLPSSHTVPILTIQQW